MLRIQNQDKNNGYTDYRTKFIPGYDILNTRNLLKTMTASVLNYNYDEACWAIELLSRPFYVQLTSGAKSEGARCTEGHMQG